MSGLAGSLVDLVLPRRCVGCGDAGVALCAGCRSCDRPFRVAVEGVEVTAAARYGAGLRRAIIAYKERDRRDLAGVLGTMLALAVRHLVTDGAGVLLVAPPSAREAAVRRGGDHVVCLGRAAARGYGSGPGPPISVVSGVVRSTRQVRDSAGLTIAERECNLAGSMTARAPRRGERRGVVIVDDVVTTGATLRETTRALRAAGWPVLGGAVVAATPRRLMAAPLAGPR